MWIFLFKKISLSSLSPSSPSLTRPSRQHRRLPRSRRSYSSSLANHHPLWPPCLPVLFFSWSWHGSVMIFPLLRPLLSNPLISCLLWAAGLGERSACSITYGKQTNNYCPDDHLHNTDNTFNMLPLLYFKYLVHGGLSWRALLNADLEIYFI